MGLFNSGKNDKVEKVSKYERHYNVPEKSSHRRSSKVRHQHGNEHPPSANRAMSQPPPTFNNVVPPSFYPGQNSFMNSPMVNAMPPNYYSGQMRFPMAPYDLSKYPFPSQPAVAQQMPPIYWNQQQQQQQQPAAQWPMMFPQANYPFMAPPQF